MNDEQKEKVKSNVAIQSAAFGAGAAVGGITKHATSSGAIKLRKGQFANQIGQAMSAAVANGGGINGAAAAGTALVLAKATAVAAAATAVAPIVATGVAIAGGTYALCKLFEWLDE